MCLDDKPQYKRIKYSSKSGGEIQINTFSFPGWNVFLNGESIRYNDMNKLKLIGLRFQKERG